ncbi:MAG: ribonuclease P [Thermoprotei archaeon]|nr:MAG: ribonuclease P [Thermoprotei archaeon]RLF24582.1 MAG: ribonuclease P [Thermoprotei archaeon]
MAIDVKDLAIERIEKLLRLADRIFYENEELARRYVSIALAISRRCRVRIPVRWRRRICRKCMNILKPGVNCTIRIRSRGGRHLVIRCLKCGFIKRIPLREGS